MNDITFDSYHTFRAESRMLVDANPSPDPASNAKPPIP
jgi:hypothetical protein